MVAKVSIIIIDNDPDVLELLSSGLASEEVKIFTAADSERGLDIVFREQPQIVIADLMMCDLNGPVVDQIRTFNPAIDVIAMSTVTTAQCATDAILRGVRGFLPKPVAVPVIQAQISRLVEKAQRRAANQPEVRTRRTGAFREIAVRIPLLMEVSSSMGNRRRAVSAAGHRHRQRIGGSETL